MTHQSDTGSVIVGAASSLGFGKLLGVVSYDDLISAFLLGAVGALGGWLVKNSFSHLGYLIKKYNKKTKRKLKSPNNETI